MAETAFDRNLYEELVDQGLHPPGADPSLGSFYRAVILMIDDGDLLGRMLGQAKQQRTDITDKHWVNLLFRSIQYIKMQQGDYSYRKFEDPQDWRSELAAITADDQMRTALDYSLRRRTTTTTIYQRYAGPYATIANLFDGTPTSIADLGCGGNHGLRGIELHETFVTPEDHTPTAMVSRLLAQPINLERGLAIDKEDPDDEEVKCWRLACSFYPKELDQLPNTIAFESKIRGSQRVQFLQLDLLTSPFNSAFPGTMDITILSTILYQLQRPAQLLLIEKAKTLLKSDGILIVQDFAEKDPDNPSHLRFNESWFGRESGYRTFLVGERTNWKFLELLQWDSGRCKTVRPGQDFSEVFQPA